MGERQERLRSLLSETRNVTERTIPGISRQNIVQSRLLGEVRRVYGKLGGILEEVPFRHQGWDIEYNGVAVELDEELHFNDYRSITLTAPLYEQLPRFPLSEYQLYARQYAGDCMRCGAYGGKWSNPSCMRQFGPAAPAGSLTDGDAPRWKQRAFYDFVKDLSPLLGGPAVIRIAIWDSIDDCRGTRTIGTVLDEPATDSVQAIAGLVRRRTPSASTLNRRKRTSDTHPPKG